MSDSRALGRDDDSWTLLAVIADLLQRGAVTGSVDWRHRGNRVGCQVTIGDIPVSEATLIAGRGASDAAFALAEDMMLRWGERAGRLDLEARGRLQPAPPTSCPSCGADPGERCQPTHDGERESGTWSHPSRGMEARVSSTASSKIAGMYVREPHRLQGLPSAIAEHLATLAADIYASSRPMAFANKGGRWAEADADQIAEDLYSLVNGLSNSAHDQHPDTLMVSNDVFKLLSAHYQASEPTVATGAQLDKYAALVGLHRSTSTHVTHDSFATTPETDEQLRARVMAAYSLPSITISDPLEYHPVACTCAGHDVLRALAATGSCDGVPVRDVENVSPGTPVLIRGDGTCYNAGLGEYHATVQKIQFETCASGKTTHIATLRDRHA